jgi:hypothetical protein
MDDNLKKVLFHLIDSKTKGVDTYNHNGSMWLIFTDQKKWVIELSKDGTLWYNHYFFKDCFKYMSLDVVENQHYITEWVEDIIQNGVRNTDSWVGKPFVSVEYIIQNGIKETIDQWNQNRPSVKDVIEKGVKETTPSGYLGSIEMKGKIVHQFESPKQNNEVEDVIQNGVRKIEGEPHDYPHTVANIIKNGVKHTEYGDWEDGDERFDDIIKNGVKETKQEEHHRLREVVQTVKNGIKETRLEQNITEGEIDDIIQNGIKETWGYEKQPQIRIDDVINKGEKTICNNNPNKL